jgi:uncharacterized protein YneF (UPF0154 family)
MHIFGFWLCVLCVDLFFGKIATQGGFIFMHQTHSDKDQIGNAFPTDESLVLQRVMYQTGGRKKKERK